MAGNSNRHKAVTIEMVAAQAGVSKTTVSFVLNNNPSISEATREKVLKVIEDLGYQPNINARNLSSKTNRCICVVMPELGHIFEDPYFARALGGVYDEVEGADYRVLLKKASFDFALNKEYLNLFRRKEIAGMIYVGSTLDDTYLKDFLDTQYPFVLVNNALPDAKLPYVCADFVQSGYIATKHLIDLGHTRIGHIAGSLNTMTARDRLSGCRKALEEAGIEYDEKLLVLGHYNREDAAEATRSLLALRHIPSAIFVDNDTMAIGVLQVLKEMGIRVPSEMAVVGGDSIELSTVMTPTLTSIELPIYEISRTAVRLLIDLIEGRSDELSQVLPTKLVVRQSCGADAPEEENGRRRRGSKGHVVRA